MTDDQQVTDLLARAVDAVPAQLLAAPQAAIRRRIRRRQAAVVSAAAAMVLVLVAGVAFAVTRPATSTVPATPPGTASAPAGADPSPPSYPLAWQVARVSRNERMVTLFVSGNQATQCPSEGSLRVVRTQTAGSITLQVLGRSHRCDGTEHAQQLQVELDLPLGDRTVLDATAPGERRLVFRDTDLPSLVTDGFIERPAEYGPMDGTWFQTVYVRSEDPELSVSAVPKELDKAPPGTHGQAQPVGTLRLGGHRTVTEYRYLDNSYQVAWTSADGSLTIYLGASVSQGVTLEKAVFEQLLRGMTWP